MNRRTFIRTAVSGSLTAGLAGMVTTASATYFPAAIDPALFTGINRAVNPAKRVGLEKSHAPVITAPSSVKAGEPFTVEVSVGENLHPMGPTHWIEYILLMVGNEPAGHIEFQSRGFLKPRVVFTVVLNHDMAIGGKVTLIARQQCNLHGLWEGSMDITVG